MNNYIIISKTFCECTPESSADGEFSDKGFISELEKVTFSQLVELMECHPHASCSPNDYGIHTWYSTTWYTESYLTGTDREESIHFHRDNTPNAEKYWRLARLFADKK